jgi:hypothetical protein
VNGNGYSRLALIGALVSVLAFALAAVLFVTGADALQRLALLFGLFGIAVPAILALLRSDEATTATNATSNIASALNGAFDQRVRNAVRTVITEGRNTSIEPVDMPGDPLVNIPRGPVGPTP